MTDRNDVIQLVIDDGKLALRCRGCDTTQQLGAQVAWDPLLNATTLFFGRHHDCVALGARVLPRDPSAEAVGVGVGGDMRTVDLKAIDKERAAKRKAFAKKAGDLFGFDPNELGD